MMKKITFIVGIFGLLGIAKAQQVYNIGKTKDFYIIDTITIQNEYCAKFKQIIKNECYTNSIILNRFCVESVMNFCFKYNQIYEYSGFPVLDFDIYNELIMENYPLQKEKYLIDVSHCDIEKLYIDKDCDIPYSSKYALHFIYIKKYKPIINRFILISIQSYAYNKICEKLHKIPIEIKGNILVAIPLLTSEIRAVIGNDPSAGAH